MLMPFAKTFFPCWRVPADPKEQKRQFIINAAKASSIELQADDLIRLQLPVSPPLPRCAARPFAATMRRKFPAMRITAWDGEDDERQPMAYSMPVPAAREYLEWAKGIGVTEEKLQLPPWLLCLMEEPKPEQQGKDGKQEEPAFFGERNSHMLMPYQRDGIKFGISRQGKVLLADDMGLGKTVQALGIAWQYRNSFPMLIVCPSSLRNVWEEQIKRWTSLNDEDVQLIFSGNTPIESNARIVVVSYALLGKSEHLQTFNGAKYKLIIADECHYIKNPDAQRSQALLRVASAAERIILVSGTPVMNSAMELYPLLQLLDPNIADKNEFAKRYFGGINTDFGKMKYIDPRREQELHSYLFKTVGIRRKKEQVLTQLPPKTRQTIKLATSHSIARLREAEAKLFNGARAEDPQWWADYRTASQCVMQCKKRCVGDYVTDVINGGIGKFLLFAHHKEMLDSLEEVLKERVGGGGYIRIDGNTQQRQRADLVKRFQEDLHCHCGLLSITALAEGQTLTSAEAVIFAELVWTPGTIDQCEGRAHRIGQQGSVLIQYLLLQDSEVDRRCYLRLEEKHHHASRVLDNKDSAFWEESVCRETGTKYAARGLGDRPTSRPKPCTAMGAMPKSRSAPPPEQIPVKPVERKAEGNSVKDEQKPAKPKSRTVPASRTPTRSPESAAPNLSGENYKVMDLLHLGLNLKIGAIYSKEALEQRCKGNEQKLGRLRFHMRDQTKLLLVDSSGPPAKRPRTE